MNLSKLAKYAIPVVITLAQPAFGLEKKISEEAESAAQMFDVAVFRNGERTLSNEINEFIKKVP